MRDHYEIIIPETIFVSLHDHLLCGGREEVALLFAHQVLTPVSTRLVVQRWEPVPADSLLIHEADAFALDSAFLVKHTKQARAHEESIVLAHSHPGDRDIPAFSRADTQGEGELYAFLNVRLPSRLHGALVVSPGGVAGRLRCSTGPLQSATVRVVGRRVTTYFPRTRKHAPESDSIRARQELIWGSRGQSQLRHARVGVIGAGGTGSVTAQQLLHLGIGTLITVDSQVAARSNLSRIVGMRQSDIDQTPKVEIVARTAQEIDPSIEVRALYSDVCNAPVLCELRDADLLFLCTDSHWSRAVVNALAVQYRIPLVDMAFAIVMNQAGTQVASATGEVRLVVPGGYCLSCAGVLDADRIRTEQADPGNRAAFPDYFVNLEVEEPSVVTVNSIVASLAVSIGADILIPTMRAVSPFDSYHYNALKGLVRHVPRVHVAACGVCGEAGISGLADDHPLPCA